MLPIEGAGLKSTADEILFLLKTRGPAQTGEIAKRLDMTRQGSRQQLERLSAEGLVRSDTARGGVGRPRRRWSLTAKGHGRFPDTHAHMTVELLEAVREEFGEAGLDRLIQRRERETERAYSAVVAPAATLAGRIELLAALRDAEGYMAEWRHDEDGSFLLVENHCPICTAAKTCQGLCRSELELFRKILGPECQVERIDHVLAGARRCAYLITQMS